MMDELKKGQQWGVERDDQRVSLELSSYVLKNSSKIAKKGLWMSSKNSGFSTVRFSPQQNWKIAND
jgi:hypothetical protein